MSAYTTNKIGVIGIVLGVCVVIVAVFAYGQILILQRNASDLETGKNYLQNQVTTLENQVATLNADKASLENQVATLNADKANLESQVAVLQCEVHGFHYVMYKDMPRERPRIDLIPK